VDIDRAEISLHGVKDVLHVDAQLHGLDTVDMRVKLRHANIEVGEHGHQARRFRRFSLDFPYHAVERLVALIGAIFDLELKASDGTETVDRWRRKDRDHRIGYPGELTLQLLRNGKSGQIGGCTLLEWLERHEDNACGWAIDEAVDREARKSDRALHARLFH